MNSTTSSTATTPSRLFQSSVIARSPLTPRKNLMSALNKPPKVARGKVIKVCIKCSVNLLTLGFSFLKMKLNLFIKALKLYLFTGEAIVAIMTGFPELGPLWVRTFVNAHGRKRHQYQHSDDQVSFMWCEFVEVSPYISCHGFTSAHAIYSMR